MKGENSVILGYDSDILGYDSDILGYDSDILGYWRRAENDRKNRGLFKYKSSKMHIFGHRKTGPDFVVIDYQLTNN